MPTALPAIDDASFALFQQMIADRAGIRLNDEKKNLLVGRLTRRIRDLNLDSFRAYYDYVRSEGEGEEVRLLDAICTNETHFFRDARQFAYFRQQVLPHWRDRGRIGPRRIRIWSAACSTGEEPFSIAMTVLAHLPEVEVQVMATDLSTRALQRAAAAEWPVEKAAEISQEYLQAFMLRGVAGHSGAMRACRALREVVRFSRLNLYADAFTSLGTFDLIFCRNVLIYFSPEARSRVVAKLLRQLAPGGWLFLGHAESLTATGYDELVNVAPSVVRLTSTKTGKAARFNAPLVREEKSCTSN